MIFSVSSGYTAIRWFIIEIGVFILDLEVLTMMIFDDCSGMWHLVQLSFKNEIFDESAILQKL